MKNPHAVALGRLGGLRGGAAGGRARALSLSPARRRQIARAAIAARWGRLPDLLRNLFWGYRFEDLTLPNDIDLVMQQVLVHGDKKQRTWLARRFGDQAIRGWIVRNQGKGLSSHELAAWVSPRTLARWLAKNPHLAIWDRR